MPNRDTEDVSIAMDQKLHVVIESQSQHCIFKVHHTLRNVNERAYEPEIIAIGPYHRGKPHLQMMEEHKWRFLKLLLRRKNERVSTYVAALRLQEEDARKCYAEQIHLSSDEFVEMMVLDGCFIIELFRKFKILEDFLRNNNPTVEINNDPQVEIDNDLPVNIKNDPLFRMGWTLNFLQRDLMLFENQLPFCILTKLHEVVEGPGQENNFINLASKFFNDLFPGRGVGLAGGNIKHLLHLIHSKWSIHNLQTTSDARTMDNIKLIRCSTKLAEYGVKFEKIENEVSFDIQFNNGSLRIPVFTIEDRTESFLRNLMAYEQYRGDTDFNIVTDYMAFFSGLIKSTEDVSKLCGRGILSSFIGENEVVYCMFSKMNDCITGPSRNFLYAEIFEKVNSHCKKPCNRLKALLRRKYMHSSWGVISILGACTLLVLAFLQVLFQILSWKLP